MEAIQNLLTTDKAFVAFVYFLGIITGIAVGYLLWRRGDRDARRLTDLQAVSFVLLTIYIFSPVIGMPEPDITIASLIIGLAGGEAIGAAIAKSIGRLPAVKKDPDEEKKL